MECGVSQEIRRNGNGASIKICRIELGNEWIYFYTVNRGYLGQKLGYFERPVLDHSMGLCRKVAP